MLYNADGTTNEGPTSYNHHMFYALNKYYDPERLAADGDGSMRGARDDYILRLSEMYLNAAEAEFMLGNGQPAYDLLKTLSDNRAIGGDGSALLAAYGINGPGNLDMDFFLDERSRELVGEHKRWYDLKQPDPGIQIADVCRTAGYP